MRRASVEHLPLPTDIHSLPLDWSELGGQILALARQLTEIHGTTPGMERRGCVRGFGGEVEPRQERGAHS